MLSHIASSQHLCSAECFEFPVFKEFLPPLKFINSIPAQAQKAFKNIDIHFTCVDVYREFIAVGSNVGIVYLYDQKQEKLHKLRNNDYTDAITCVKLIVSLECLVTVGSKSGTVLAFKIPFNAKEQVEKFTVEGLHKAPVTALEWNKNGIKFFSGDSNGVVVCTEIDHLEHQSRSYVVLEENKEIVQLSYFNMMLLVSTLYRQLLYHFEQKEIFQVGQKDRKGLGKFGAVFFHMDGSTLVCASRSGQRVCKSDLIGGISETLILKNILSEPHHSISFKQAVTDCPSLKDTQFGPLKVYNEKFLLTWSENCVFFINPYATTVESICGFDSVVDAACWKEEIYILQGFRHLIRIDVHESAERYYTETSIAPKEGLPEEFNYLNVENKETGNQENTFEENVAPKLLSWFKRKFSDGVAQDENEELDYARTERANTVDVVLPSVVKLDNDFAAVHVFDKLTFINESETSSKEEKVRTDMVYSEIVFKPQKKKKRKKKEKKVHFSADSEKAEDIELTSETKFNRSTSFIDDDFTSSIDVSDLKELNATKEKKGSDTVDLTNNSCSELSTEHEKSRSDSTLHTSEKLDEVDNILLENVLPTVKIDNVGSTSKASSQEVDSHDEPASPDDIYSSFKFDKSETELDTGKIISNDNNSTLCENNDNSIEFSSDSFREPDWEVPKYGSDWVQYKTPGPLLSLSASKSHVFCVDNQNIVYMSEFPVLGFVWKKLEQRGEQIAVSPSEHIVWVLYKGTIYAARRESDSWKSIEWVGIARDIAFISVDDSCAWYVSSNGELISMNNISETCPYSYPQHVEYPGKAIQVTCRNSVIWVLTSDSKVYCRADIHSSGSNTYWKELRVTEMPSIGMITFGANQNALLVTQEGTFWFITGISNMVPEGQEIWEVESSTYTFKASGSKREAVMRVINNDLLNSLIYTQHPPIIASSEAGVWYCKQMDSVLYSNQKRVIGHTWDTVLPVGIVVSMKWKSISAEGIISAQGEIWSCTTSGELFCFSIYSVFTNPVVVDLPSSVSLKCVVPTTNSLWILSSSGGIYIRREMSKRCPQGMWWQQLDITQLEEAVLSHISCAGDSVWACDNSGEVYFRYGSLNPSPGATLNQAWINVDSNTTKVKPFIQKLSAIGKQFPIPIVHPSCKKIKFSKVYVGPNAFMIWAIDDKLNVYMRDGITSTLLVGEAWIPVPSPHAKQLCVSSKAVWLLKQSGRIFRRFGISKDNPTGDYWKEIPGRLSYLSVTVDDDLWGVQHESLCCHTSYVLQYQKPSDGNERSGSVSEDDWEDVHVSSD